MAQPDSSNPVIQSTASSQNSNTSPPRPNLGSQDPIQASPAANLSNVVSISGGELPPAVKLLIEKEVERRAKELRRAGYLWTDMPLHEKAWFIVSNCILLATFATTIWLGISQRRADQATVAMAKTADESETTAIEALNQTSASNNISATSNNNAAYQEWFAIEQYCENNPKSNFTFVNATGKYDCSQILNTSIGLPNTCGNGENASIQCAPPSGEKASSGGRIGIAVGVTLGVIITLVSIYCYLHRRRTNKRILGGSGTTEI